MSVGDLCGGHGATVARLIPDQKVGCSNHPVLIFPLLFPVSLFRRLVFHFITESISLTMLSTVFEAAVSDLCPSSAPFFGFMGVAASIIFASRFLMIPT